MPPPQRPTEVRIVEAYETDAGHFECWATVAGHELHFVFEPGAIANRKLVYGLAELVEREDGTIELVDLADGADEQAIRHLFEEHLDRFEDVSHDWREQTPPARGSQSGHALGHRRTYSRRRDMERAVGGIGRRAPQRKPPVMRRLSRDPSDRPKPGPRGLEYGPPSKSAPPSKRQED